MRMPHTRPPCGHPRLASFLQTTSFPYQVIQLRWPDPDGSGQLAPVVVPQRCLIAQALGSMRGLPLTPSQKANAAAYPWRLRPQPFGFMIRPPPIPTLPPAHQLQPAARPPGATVSIRLSSSM
jgi:hypothetical protein